MENMDWPPDFPLAPSHCELQHDWGSGGPLSNVGISHVAKANATSEKYWRKQSAKIPFAPPWVNCSPEGLSCQGIALVPKFGHTLGCVQHWAQECLSCAHDWAELGTALLRASKEHQCPQGPSIYGAVEHTRCPWKPEQKDFSAATASPFQCLHLAFCDQCCFDLIRITLPCRSPAIPASSSRRRIHME